MCRCDERLNSKIEGSTHLGYTGLFGGLEHLCNLKIVIILLFIIRVKRELKRVYRNGCRYNERLNDETGGSKTPRIHWVARVNIE